METNEVKKIIEGYEKERDSLIVKLNMKLEEAKLFQNKIQFISGKIEGYVELSNRLLQAPQIKKEPEPNNEEPKVEPESTPE